MVLAVLLCGCGAGREEVPFQAERVSVILPGEAGDTARETGRDYGIDSGSAGEPAEWDSGGSGGAESGGGDGTGSGGAEQAAKEGSGGAEQPAEGKSGGSDGTGSVGAWQAALEGSGAAGEPVSEESGGELPELSLVMVGDILLHTPVAESGRRGEEYDFSAVFAQVKEEIQTADLALVNQEVILGGAELGISGYPAFNAPYELGDALAEAGFDVVLHATNHALDKGKRGLANCLSFWQEKHPELEVLGIHASEASQEEIYVYEQEEIRVAILNYTYGTNGIALPEDMPYAVDLLERDRVAADLGRARDLADFVIVCPHWGTEYLLDADGEQEDWAEFFVQNGADLVLGTHPHVIEPVAWVEAACDVQDGGAGRGLVYYSLGNFVNWTSGTGSGVADRMVGGMARIVIGPDEDGQVSVRSYGVEPLICHVEQGFGGVTVYPLADYTEELAARNEIVKQDGSFSLDYCRRLVENVFGTLAEEMKTVPAETELE